MDSLVPFTLDLTAHEDTRLAAVLDALGPRWNPTDIHTGEAQAHQMLYARLDAGQRPPTMRSWLPACSPAPPEARI